MQTVILRNGEVARLSSWACHAMLAAGFVAQQEDEPLKICPATPPRSKCQDVGLHSGSVACLHAQPDQVLDFEVRLFKRGRCPVECVKVVIFLYVFHTRLAEVRCFHCYTMENYRDEFSKTREDEQPPNTRDQGQYSGQVTDASRTRRSPYGPYPQTTLPRNTQIGAARPSYPAGREPLRLTPGYKPRWDETSEVKPDKSGPGRTPCTPAPAFQGPKIGGAQPLHPAKPVPSNPPRPKSQNHINGRDMPR